MKNFKVIVLAILFGTFVAALFSACYQPSPLYGSWADNAGNKISFTSDGSFTATIVDSEKNKQTYSGSYTVIENIISLSKDDGSINTEWDIRGGLLYLTWTDSYGEQINLTLYHN